MWSIATEWQIYFLLPALLLPVWRAAGGVAMVGVGFLVGIGLHFVSHHFLSPACPWFIGSFAVGAMAALIGFADGDFYNNLRTRAPWGLLTLGLIVLIVGVYAFVQHLAKYGIFMDVLASVAAACTLIYCTGHTMNPPRVKHPLALRCFQARPVVALGAFSYSLYLTHYPVVATVYMILRQAHLTSDRCLIGLFLLGLPASLLVGYCFYLLFEKPFTSARSKSIWIFSHGLPKRLPVK